MYEELGIQGGDIDLGNVPRARRGQVGSGRKAKNRYPGAKKLLGLDLFKKCSRDRDFKTSDYSLHS